MKKQSAPKEKNSLKIVLFFVATVAILVFISLVVKAILMIRVSKFDGMHRFTVLVEQKHSVLEVLSFDPGIPSLSLLQLGGKLLPRSQAGNELGLFFDSSIVLPDDLHVDQQSSNGMKTLLWNFGRLQTNLTLYDVLRLYLISHSTTLANKHIVTLQLPADATAVDKLVSGTFMDAAISQENESVQVINASGAPGMANRLARVLTNMGSNVVSVTTSQTSQKHSAISYFGTDSYTVLKLSNLLAYPRFRLHNETIADIVITIGEDSVGTKDY